MPTSTRLPRCSGNGASRILCTILRNLLYTKITVLTTQSPWVDLLYNTSLGNSDKLFTCDMLGKPFP